MKTIITLSALVLTLSAQADRETVSQIEVKGELICLTCYLKDGLKATGSDHIGCAVVCYNQGLPQAILGEESGVIYLPITTEISKRGTEEESFVCSLIEHTPVRESLKNYLGKTITITGRTFPGNGVTLLSIDKLVANE